MRFSGPIRGLVVVARGDSVSGALGFDRLRTTVMPLVWQLLWGISLPFVPGIPMPGRITMQIGPAVDWSSHGAQEAEDPAIVDRCYEEITSAMQGG
jgi:hypothetical protein